MLTEFFKGNKKCFSCPSTIHVFIFYVSSKQMNKLPRPVIETIQLSINIKQAKQQLASLVDRN